MPIRCTINEVKSWTCMRKNVLRLLTNITIQNSKAIPASIFFSKCFYFRLILVKAVTEEKQDRFTSCCVLFFILLGNIWMCQLLHWKTLLLISHSNRGSSANSWRVILSFVTVMIDKGQMWVIWILSPLSHSIKCTLVFLALASACHTRVSNAHFCPL